MEIKANGLVKAKNSTNYSEIKDSLNLLTKSDSKKKAARIEWTKIAVRRHPNGRVLNALELHNNAIKINEPQTQLLTLWTIIEVAIDTKQNYMSRSTYITNILSSILCNNYYYSVLKTLYEQISKTPKIINILKKEPRGINEFEKLAYILKDNSALQSKLITALNYYPLEKYKIENLIEIFSSKEKMKANLTRHSNRLRWQIMRIYRNRCMIVHNGSNFPYIENILENLHYYVDELIDYIFAMMKIGVNDLEAMFSHARIKESSNLDILDNKTNTLTDEEYYKIIFNIQ